MLRDFKAENIDIKPNIVNFTTYFPEYSPSFSGIPSKTLSKSFRHAKVIVRGGFFTIPVTG